MTEPAGLALVQVVPLQVGHWPHVRDIYASGIATGHATFLRCPTAASMPGSSSLVVISFCYDSQP